MDARFLKKAEQKLLSSMKYFMLPFCIYFTLLTARHF
jgi:hypothetical protein